MAISFDFTNKLINLTAPHSTNLLVQDLADAIRDVEDSELGMQYPAIADTSGKADLGGGVLTGITVSLNSPWQIKHPAGNYQAVISGGNLVGGLNNNPVAYVSGVQVKLLQSANATIATVSTGSGLDATQDAKLTRIHTLLDVIENGLSHQDVMKVLLAAMAGKVSGAETSTIKFRDNADALDRIVAATDTNGNRTAVTLNVS